MKSLIAAVAVAVAVLAVVACKDKEPEPPKGAEAMVAALKKMAESATKGMGSSGGQVDSKDPMAGLKALGELGKKLAGGMKNALGGKAGGPVVNWRKLAVFLPDSIGGWPAVQPIRGSTGGMGSFKTSRVSRRYRTGQRSLNLEIIDTSLAPFMRMGFSMVEALDMDSDSRIRKGMKIAGNPAIFTYRKRRKRSQVQTLVADRFLVRVRITPAEKAEEAVELVGKLNLGGIAALKN